jgi:hypothetical protein
MSSKARSQGPTAEATTVSLALRRVRHGGRGAGVNLLRGASEIRRPAVLQRNSQRPLLPAENRDSPRAFERHLIGNPP